MTSSTSARGLEAELTLDALAAAFSVVRRSPAAGVDGVTAQRFDQRLDRGLGTLRRAVLDRTYRPARLLHLSRPKAGGGFRRLGVPTVADRVLQRAVLAPATARLDRGFLPHVHGFRPKRSPATALRDLVVQVGERSELSLVKVDVKAMFDSLPHAGLDRAACRAWSDDLWCWLVRTWIRAWGEAGRGVPQGAPLSPLLSNLFLAAHVDPALHRPGPGAPRLVAWIRYADDLVVVPAAGGPAWRVLAWLEGVMSHAGLALSRDKVHVCASERRPITFTLLGRPARFRRAGSLWRLEVT